MSEENKSFMADTTPKYYCYNHPQRETMLRCNRCERPICSECAVLTPTGYRCKECIRGQQKTFDTAQWLDYPLAVAAAGVLSFLGSYLAGFLWFFILMAAPIVGVIIAEAVRWVVHRRRSRLLWQVTTVAVVVGSEGEGIRPLVRSKCDFLLRLPMQGQVESLNAAVAGSVALYLAYLARHSS